MKFSNHFICANDAVCSFENPVNAPYFRKRFSLDFIPEHAEITICGLGFYELYINGTEITKGAMAPYISNTDDLCYYDNYDVTALLREGENVIGILLGNGFRNPFGGFVWGFEKAHCRGPVTLALCLEARRGEQTLELEADESFRTHPSPILFDDLRMGYHYDARLELPHWNEVGFDDGAWEPAICGKAPKGEPKLCEAEPIAVRREIRAVEIRHYDELAFAYKSCSSDAEPHEETIRPNVFVYDFGVNTAGVTQLRINGKPGQVITVRHGESLIGDRFSINTTTFDIVNAKPEKKWRGEIYKEYSQKDVFICKGGEEVFTPRFKYDGFRYAYVEGLEPEQATADALVYLEMSSALKERATFSCSNETLNRLQECARRSDLANFFYFPTDCPHREKNGWTGDAAMSAEHMMLNLTAEKSLAEWLANIRKAQATNGALPGIVPTGGWGFDWGNGPIWDSVCVQLPYYIYKFTGDKTVIEENAAMILRYLVYVRTRRDERGLVAIGLGDWVDPFKEITGKYASPLVFTDSATVYDFARKAETLLRVIGRGAEAEYAAAVAAEMRRDIRESLIDFETMTVIGDCQTSQAVAIAYGLFDENELERAKRRLVEIIHRDGDINTCGMLGLRYIFHVLAQMGETDLALKIITGKTRTCYGYWLENGATSLWEDFRDVEQPRQGSKNHHFLGDLSSFFIQRLAGISPNPDLDDPNLILIVPNFPEGLDFAEASYDAPLGRISVRWERQGGEILLRTVLEGDVHARLRLPAGYALAEEKDLLTGETTVLRVVRV